MGYDDLDLAHEIANKAKRAKAQFKQCLSLSDTYNTRERLLGLPISNVGLLESFSESAIDRNHSKYGREYLLLFFGFR